jgi:hypothetical protein
MSILGGRGLQLFSSLGVSSQVENTVYSMLFEIKAIFRISRQPCRM